VEVTLLVTLSFTCKIQIYSKCPVTEKIQLSLLVCKCEHECAVCSAGLEPSAQRVLSSCSAAEKTKITRQAGLYLYEMFVDPFCESFLLHPVSFICEKKDGGGNSRKERKRDWVNYVTQQEDYSIMLCIIYKPPSGLALNSLNLWFKDCKMANNVFIKI